MGVSVVMWGVKWSKLLEIWVDVWGLYLFINVCVWWLLGFKFVCVRYLGYFVGDEGEKRREFEVGKKEKWM